MGEDWRYLIIFDACRADYFIKEYYENKQFEGKYETRDAGAIWTLEWLMNNFTEKYKDIAYISPVWFCNSFKAVERQNLKFNGGEVFAKVYNCWQPIEKGGGWDIQKGTVLPKYINKIALKAIMKHPEWRFIIHYFQPHAPYLSITNAELPYKDFNVKPIVTLPFKKKLSRKITACYQSVFGLESLWKMIKLAGMKPRTRMEAAWRTVGTEGIRFHYKINLHIVMNHAKNLIEHLPPGKVVITADHGELLGEKRWWGHGPPKPRIPELTNVPWLEIKR